MSKKILVIAPHADDEVLGCGGYLISESRKGSEIKIVIGTIGGLDKRQDFSTRLNEAFAVADCLKAKMVFIFKGMDAMMDTIPEREIVSAIDKIVDEFRPDEILINCISHHQDHRKMYYAAMASMRMREGYMPKMIALYEYPCLEPGETIEGGRCYHDISDVVEEKVKMLDLYASQIRREPSPINGAGVRSLASIRGRECGCQYAELFYIQRMCL